MSLLNKYVQKYGNYDQVKRLQKSKDWMPQTPSSAEKESNVAAAHQYMDSLTDDDKKRIQAQSPLGKSAGMQATDNGFLGLGSKNKDYKTYEAAQSILQTEEYEKKRADVVRKNGSQAYKSMKNYIDLVDQARDAQKGGGTLGAIIGSKDSKNLRSQAAEVKKTLNAMGISGKDFDVYEQYVREYKDIEATQAMQKNIANKLAEKPISRGIGYTAADVLASPITGFMATAESLKRPFYADPSAPVNTYSDLYRLQNMSNAVEREISEKINNPVGRFAYNAGVSTLKSAEAMAISSALGGALGFDASSKLGQLVTLPMFGTSAYAQSLQESQEKGFSSEKAYETALASGISEMLFEELSLDKAWGTYRSAKAGTGGLRKRILDIFMGAGIEGSEELFTDMANFYADNFEKGDFSDYQSGIRQRVEHGMSLDQATREAKKEYLTQLGESFLAGAASGLAMNVGSASIGSVKYHNTAKNINKNVELKREVVESAKGLKDTTAAEIANNKKVEDITESDMVEIIHSMEEVSGKSAHDIAKESLVKMGESEEEAEKKANEIVEAVSEDNPTEEQEAKNTKLVEDEKVAEAYTDVLKNRVAQNALSDVYENNQKVKQKRSGGVNALSNGNKIKVYDFADVDKGIVNTSVGTMSLDSVQLSENERRLFKTAYVFDNDNAANAYVNGYKGQNIADYSNAAMRAFTVGASGASFETFLNDPHNAILIESVDNNAFLHEMYFHGQNMIKAEEVAKVDKNAKGEAKANTQSDLQSVFNEVAKVFNLSINEGGTEGESSGSFIPSSLKLNLNEKESKNLYQTLHHELMEYSKAYAPKEYNELKSAIMDFATQKLGSAKVKMHLELYKDTYRNFGKQTGNESEAKKTLADATDEYINDFVAMVMSTDEGVNQFVNYLADNSDLTEQQKTGIIQSLKDFIQKLIDSIKAFISKHTGMNLGASDAKALTQYTEDLARIRDKIQNAWDASRAEVEEQLRQGGVEITSNGDTAAHSVRTRLWETWEELGYNKYEDAVEDMAKKITNQMVAETESEKVRDEFYKKALNWVRAEESIAAFILESDERQKYLDYVADDRYQAIKKNSDYPQGTVDFSNLCRKREIFTKMFDNLQKKNPTVLFTAQDIADIRQVLVDSNLETACALCYVEDRRQKMGEIADKFIQMYKNALKNPQRVILKENSNKELKKLVSTKEQNAKFGYEEDHVFKAVDDYVPTQYDLVTYEGLKQLEINHPETAHAFERYNSSRGMASARLIEGHAEYKREILKYGEDQVKRINNYGGLKMSSFSDMEGIHIIDMMQVIMDCAAMGIKVQCYTKVPEFAEIAKDTKIKMNRSLIPANKNSKKAYAFIDGKWQNVSGKLVANGIAKVDGKEYLAVDIVEGIDVTNPSFINDHENPNVGNIIIGISDRQIRLAMADPNIDYIIPFHTGQKKKVLQTKGIHEWENAKKTQVEKPMESHTAADLDAINIYTDVIDKYNVTNKKDFVKYFLKECKENHLVPRFEKYKGVDGYEKLLIDYKLFDRDGNILPQEVVQPTFSDENLEVIKGFLTKDMERSQNIEFSDEVMDKIKEAMKKNKKKVYSVNVDSEGKTLTEDQVELFKDSKIVDENGNLKVMYHGTDEGGFTVFDPSKSDDDLSLFFSDNPEVSKTYTKEHPTEFNPYLKDMDIKTAEDAIKYLESRGWKIEEPKKTDDGSTKWTYHYPGMGKATCDTESLIEHARESQKSHKAFLYPVYLNVKNPYVIDAEGHNWNDIFMPEQAKDKDLMKKVYRLIRLMKNYVDRGYGIGQLSETLGDLKNSVEYAIEEFGIEEDEDYRDDAKEMRKLAAEIDEIYEKWNADAHLDEDDDPTPMGRYIVNSDEEPRTTRYIARWAYNHGFDGVYIKNVVDIGAYGDYEKLPSNIAIAFESNQVKSVYNEHPTNNEDIRYSLNVDSEGKELSPEQKEFFKDSKARDENGNLLVLYHGSSSVEKFNEFKLRDTVNGRVLGDGFYFTPDEDAAKEWGTGTQFKVYLNLKNPYIIKGKQIDAPSDVLKAYKEQLGKSYDERVGTEFGGMPWWGNEYTRDEWINKWLEDHGTNSDDVYTFLRDADKTIRDLGYDGVIYQYVKGESFGLMGGTQYVAFYPNQIKKVTNKKPTEKSNDIRYSLNVDSEGRRLSKEQAEYFKDSKARNADGSLMTLYHGTDQPGFTKFGNPKNWFTSSKNVAASYASTTNPMLLDNINSLDALNQKLDGKDIQVKKETGKYVVYQKTFLTEKNEGEYTTLADTIKRVNELLDEYEEGRVYEAYINVENPLEVDVNGADWDNIEYNGKTYESYTLADYARRNGYDGLILRNVIDVGPDYEYAEMEPESDVVVAFKPEQIKSVDNQHPTDNDDIRYSLEVEDWDRLFNEMTEVKESNRILAEGLKSIDNVKLNEKITNKIASEIKSEYKSRIDKKVLAKSLEKVFSYMLDSGSPNYTDLSEIMKEVAKPVIEQATEVMPEEKRMYDEFREHIKGYKIRLNASQKAEVAKTFDSYYAFKNALFGHVTFSESGDDLDSLWQGIVEASNGMLDIGENSNTQPIALYEFIQGLKPTYKNIYGADQEEAAYDVALSIFRKFLLEQEYENNPKLRQEALKLNEAHQKYRQTLKQNSDKRIKEEMAKIKIERDININRLIKEINELNAEESNVIKGSIEQAFIIRQKREYEARLKRLREYKNEQMDKKLAELRAQQRDSQTKRIQSRQITQAKAKIRKNIETLNSMLAHGTEKKHVPINMVRATIEMLEAIDINTGNSKSLAQYLEKMDNIYKGLKGAEAYAFDYDERTQQTIATLKKMFDGRNYTMLSLDELNQVVEITKQLVTQIQNANKLMFEKKRLDAIDFSKQAIKEVREAKHIDNKFMNALDKYLTPHLNAYREFRKLSGYTDGAIMELYKDLDKGQLKQLQVMKDINALFDDVLKDTKEVKKFTSTDEKDLVDSGLKDEKGNPVMITKAQRMALIMSSYNAKNMEHITYGGVKVPDITKKKREDALAKGKTYWYESPIEIRDAIYGEDTEKLKLITERASMKVKALEKELSPWEQKFLEKTKEMFWKKTGALINKTSLELKGYALARVSNYFPIISDKNFVNQDVGGLIQDGTLEGWGNLKERKFGRNAIVLEDITDTILRQTNDVAKYVGLVIPIRNLNVAWNTNVYDVTTAKRDTLINAIDQAWGANNKKYIENLIKDMTRRRDGGDPTFLDALRGRFAGAVLTLNPSVAIKQSASYFTAGAIVGNKTLAKTVKDIGKGFITKKGIPELEAINPLLWYRNQGNATQELADMKRTGFGKNLPTWAQKAINWVEFMDTGTIRTLEYAAKNYVDDHYIGKNKLEGEEYWQKVSEVFTKIVEETQPNYTPLQQADIIRNPNKALKLLVMFKTQPLQNMGTLYDAVGELRAKTKAEDQDGIKSAKKKVARAIVSQIQSAMTFSMMTILADILLHKYYKYKDDDDKFSWEKVLSKFGAGITDSFWGMLLFGQDAYKAVDSFINGEEVNGLSVSFLENIANLANAIQKLRKESQKRLDAVTEEDKQKYDNGIIIDVGNVLNYFGQIAGVPIGNLKNMAESLILYSMDVRDGKIGENELSRNVDSQNERMYEALINNDSERYHKLFDEAVLKKVKDGKSEADAEETVIKGIKKMIQNGYDSGELTYDEAFTILTKEFGMSEEDTYFKLDEWLYKSGGNSSYSKYSRMFDAINNALETDDRKGILEEVKKLKDNDVDAKNIQSMITKEFKPKYLELKAQNKSATIRSILISAYMATGLSRDDAEKRIDNWK